jgi:FxsC-like protein
MPVEIYGDDERRPYFFLSYARSRFRPDDGTDPDRWVTKLYKDLCHDVGIVTGASTPGFMDRQIPAGRQWPDHLAEALASCRVFLALLSPAYFTSEYCGKEWAAFLGRIKSEHACLDRPLAIIPALWTRMGPSDLPTDLKYMQYLPPDFPPQYAAEGFYGIMKLARYREQYKQAILRLARLVKDTAEEANLATGPISDFEALGNAFSGHRGGNRGRSSIKITVAAHRLSGLPPGRDPYYYGHSMHEWAPYRDTRNTTPLASYAERVIMDLGHEPTVDTVDDPSPERRQSPTVLLVDPWSSKDPLISDKLRRIDEDPVNVLVPFNDRDRETVAATGDLTRSVEAALGRGLVLPGSAKSIPSLEAFRVALPKAVAEAMSRYFREAPAHPPEISATMTRPTLQLPDK